MAQPTGREVKDGLNDQFARIGKAVASPKRLEILDLLGQGERTVEGVAHATAMGLANTSAHLQALRAARLVETRKEGTKVFYRLSGDEVSRFLVALRDLASGRLAEVERIVRDYFEARDRLEPVSREELVKRIRRKEVVVVDVRPAEDQGKLGQPLGELPERLPELPLEAEIVAYCRGPYCVLAPQALEMLRASGLPARRLVDGFPEWRIAGLPVATGAG